MYVCWMQSAGSEMFDPDRRSTFLVAPKRAVSNRRRLQNRLAQQKFRERQKTEAAAGVDQFDAAAFNDLDAVAADLHYCPREAAFLSDFGRTASSSLNAENAPLQWYTPPMSCVDLPTQPLPKFDAMRETSAVPNASHRDVPFEEMFGLEEPTLWLTESNSSTLAGRQRLLSSQIATTPGANRPSSASTRPLDHLPGPSQSPTSSSCATSASSMQRLSPEESSAVFCKYSTKRSPLLHVAIGTGKTSMVRLLLRRGISTINEQDTNGRTALHVAAQSGDGDMVQALLEYGADPQSLDRHGRDALRYAVAHGHEDVVEILLDAVARRR